MKPYCVYLTIYRGNKNKMPPFYIGSTSVDKILNKKYHGSVSSKRWKKTWNSEIKDNPHLFESKIVCTHETRQEALDKEYKLQVALNILKKPEMYINQAVANVNGYFGRDVSGENHPLYGIERSEETRKRISDNHADVSGSNNPMFGKEHKEETLASISKKQTGKISSEEKRKKISDFQKGRPKSEETRKRISIASSGSNNAMFGVTGENHPNYGIRRKWVTNGVSSKMIRIDEIIPVGWYRGITRGTFKRKPSIP